MAPKQSMRNGSPEECPEHWIPELMISVVLRGMGGSVSVRSRSEELTFMTPVGRVREITMGHWQVKPTSQCMNFKIMVLKSTKSTS